MSDDPFGVHTKHHAAVPADFAAAVQRKDQLLNDLVSYWLWYHEDEAGEFIAEWATDKEYASSVVADSLLQVQRLKNERRDV